MDYNRLQKVLRWNIIANKHKIKREAISYPLGFLFFVITTNLGHWIYRENYTLNIGASIILYLCVFFIFAKASQVCINMQTKTDFINYGMLPATKSEKFIARVALQTAVTIALMIVGLIVADIVQFIIGFITSGNTESLTLCILSHIVGMNIGSFNALEGLFVFILAHATYVLGGTFFRRHQFFFTSILVVAIPLVLGTVISLGFAGLMFGIYEAGYEVSVEWFVGPTGGRIICDILTVLTAALFYYLAYRYFCRNQVINNKAFN